jgi:hypothetical protein
VLARRSRAYLAQGACYRLLLTHLLARSLVPPSSRQARLNERMRNTTIGRNKVNGSSLNNTSVKCVEPCLSTCVLGPAT